MTIPLCQQCGKKIYASYGRRGYLSQDDNRFNWFDFMTEQERDAHEIPSNASEVERRLHNHSKKKYILWYSTPQQPRDGLFHNRSCWENWHESHRDDIERVIRSRGEWRS